MEIVDAAVERVKQRFETVYLDARNFGQTVDVGVPGCGVGHVGGLVGAPGWQNLRRAVRCGYLLVILQVVNRVVGGASRLNVHFPQHSPNAELVRFEHFRRAVPNLVGRFGIEQRVNAEVEFQLEVSPVVERVPQRVRNRLRPRVELLAVGGVARHKTFVDAVGTHCPPFVVVAREPNLRNIVELPIFSNLLRNQMRMIIDNRLIFCEVVIEFLRCFRLQQEIISNESFHISLFLVLGVGCQVLGVRCFILVRLVFGRIFKFANQIVKFSTYNLTLCGNRIFVGIRYVLKGSGKLNLCFQLKKRTACYLQKVAIIVQAVSTKTFSNV